MRVMLIALVLLVPAGASVPASASVAGDQRAGAALWTQLRSGATTCSDLSGADLGRLGAYAMGQMLGSTAGHAAMDMQMTAALGAPGAVRMHQAVGARAAGCTAGGAMMFGGPGPSWMRDGSWQRMSPDQWRDLAGSRMTAHHADHHGRNALTISLLVLGVVGLASLAVVAVGRSRQGRTPPAAPV